MTSFHARVRFCSHAKFPFMWISIEMTCENTLNNGKCDHTFTRKFGLNIMQDRMYCMLLREGNPRMHWKKDSGRKMLFINKSVYKNM